MSPPRGVHVDRIVVRVDGLADFDLPWIPCSAADVPAAGDEVDSLDGWHRFRVDVRTWAHQDDGSWRAVLRCTSIGRGRVSSHSDHR